MSKQIMIAGCGVNGKSGLFRVTTSALYIALCVMKSAVKHWDGPPAGPPRCSR